MHAVFFGLKRAHHSTLRISRTMLARIGLTAARFDLLYALNTSNKSTGRGIRQATLRRVLGVGRTTVSRMLASLEQLGLIKRTVDWLDRRQKLVQLTGDGRHRIAVASRRLVYSGWAQLALDTALCGNHGSDGWCDTARCTMATATIDGMLNHLRRAFGDGATLHYPWSPDDFDDPWEDILAMDHGDDTPAAGAGA
jgi:DNA-binding MarR family transcriptional regulator